jgi:UDP-glucose/GDP-mannose dehydrogenase family, NAD binding domain
MRSSDEVERIVREARPDADVAVASNPEFFLREGAAIHDIKHPDRIVVGTLDERAKRIVFCAVQLERRSLQVALIEGGDLTPDTLSTLDTPRSPDALVRPLIADARSALAVQACFGWPVVGIERCRC